MHAGLILYFGLCALTGYSQSISPTKDTLQLARDYAYKNQYSTALRLMKSYRLNHPTDSRAAQLELKITYWNNTKADLKKNYEQAIQAFPENQSIQLDYAIYLYEQQENKEAYKLLTEYIKIDTVNLEAKYIMGLICYADGNFNEALHYTNEILKRDSSHLKATGLKQELLRNTSPYLSIQSKAYQDKQPVSKLVTSVEYGIYRSKLLAPFISFQTQQIKNQADYFGLEIGNKIQLPKHFHTTLQAGVAKLPAQTNNVVFTYDILCRKNIGKNIAVTARLDSKPYLYTYSSLRTAIKPLIFQASFNWGKTYSPFEHSDNTFKKISNWNMHSGYIHQQYQDHNSITTLYAWALSPVIQVHSLQLRIGYSYSYANSREVRYDPVHTLADIEANWAAYTPVAGYYNPYFTPVNQQIHSVITHLNYIINTHWYISYKSTVGFYAHGDAPYIYTDNMNNTTIFAEALSRQRYTPFDIQVSTGIAITARTTCTATYSYTRAFFFDSQQIQFALNYIFKHE